MIGYLTAIGTIDNGGTGDAHTIGAVIFFIVLFIMIVLLTHLTIKMRQWDSSFISRKSYFMKLGLCGYLLLVWVYCLIGLVL